MSIPERDEGDVKWYDNHYSTSSRTKDLIKWHYACSRLMRDVLKPTSRFLEIGCGQSPIIQHMIADLNFPPEQISGLDQSNAAVDYLQQKAEGSDIRIGDAYHLPYKDNSFDIAVMLEAIEHFRYPGVALAEVSRVLKDGGYFLISFPNYSNWPWLILRILAEKMKKPSWVHLQPVDHIFFYSTIRAFLSCHGFRFVSAYGSNYFPPVFYRIESKWMTHILNSFGLSRFSFHPVLLVQKQDAGSRLAPY